MQGNGWNNEELENRKNTNINIALGEKIIKKSGKCLGGRKFGSGWRNYGWEWRGNWRGTETIDWEVARIRKVDLDLKGNCRK